MFGLFKKNVAVVQTVNKITAAVKAPTKEKDESSSDEEGGGDDAPEVAAKLAFHCLLCVTGLC
jgi:hypothetical protein